MRCLALAQGWKDTGGDVVFITHCDNKGLLERIKREGFKIYPLKEAGDTEETMAILNKESHDWVVLDGYHFGCDYQRAFKEMGHKLLVIDDYAHLEHYHADIILNQNLGAERYAYNTSPGCRLLLGTRYTLLRREFQLFASKDKQVPEIASNVLVTMGGIDMDNNAGKVISALTMIDEPIGAKVVAGFGNPNLKELCDQAELSRHDIEVLQAVEDMPGIMQWADMAVSAGGSTVWELAFMGVPTVLCITADNQMDLVETLSLEGFPSVGWMRKADIFDVYEKVKTLCYNNKLRRKLLDQGRKIIDSRGAIRVAEAMEQLS